MDSIGANMSDGPQNWDVHHLDVSPNGRSLTISTFAKPAKLGFTNPETNRAYENLINGDAVRFHRLQNNRQLRVVVVDGVTGSKQLDLPNGYTNPAVYAKDTAIEAVPSAVELPGTLFDINTTLHDPDKGVLSPNVCVSVADIEVTETGMTAELLRAGDCEIYGYRTNSGWFQILDEDMLTDSGRSQYEALKVELLPEINRVRTEKGMESSDFKRLFAVFQKREEEILGDHANWRSLPIGRYNTSTLSSREFMTATQDDLEALLLTSDGPHTSDNEPFAAILNTYGKPSNIPPSFFASRREGWNDIAAALVIPDQNIGL